MAITGLTLIGESINDSVPSTRRLFDAGDLDGIVQLARFQAERGADYLDVNVGTRPPEFMAEVVRRIQEVTDRPLSIDTPDLQMARAGLEAYDAERAGGAVPILNSISPLRRDMFQLLAVHPFRPILLVSERLDGDRSRPCRSAEETYQAARFLARAAREVDGRPLANDDLIFDPGIAPLASDSEGHLRRILEAMEKIHADPDLAGVHVSVGLTNFTVMLPAKRADGSPLKGPLESAFLTRAMPLGLDMIVGSVRRKYERLAEDHPAMRCLDAVLQADGFEAIMRVRDFYS